MGAELALLWMFMFCAGLITTQDVYSFSVRDSVAANISDVTLITSFFNVHGKFNNNHTSYAAWQRNFLSKVTNPIIVFTDNESHAQIREFRGDLPMNLFQIDSIWSLPCYTPEFKNRYVAAKKRLQWHLDLYAIWNAKPHLLSRGAQLNPFNSQYFLWVDIGCFRQQHHPFVHWPAVSRLNQLFTPTRYANSMLFFAVTPVTEIHDLLTVSNVHDGLLKKTVIQAACFGGRKAAVVWYEQEFYKYLFALTDHGKHNKNMPGNEQQVMNNMIGIHRNRDGHRDTRALTTSFLVADMNKAAHDCHGKDKWFMFQHFLATPAEQQPYNCPPSSQSLDLVYDMTRSTLQKMVRISDQ